MPDIENPFHDPRDHNETSSECDLHLTRALALQVDQRLF